MAPAAAYRRCRAPPRRTDGSPLATSRSTPSFEASARRSVQRWWPLTSRSSTACASSARRTRQNFRLGGRVGAPCRTQGHPYPPLRPRARGLSLAAQPAPRRRPPGGRGRRHRGGRGARRTPPPPVGCGWLRSSCMRSSRTRRRRPGRLGEAPPCFLRPPAAVGGAGGGLNDVVASPWRARAGGSAAPTGRTVATPWSSELETSGKARSSRQKARATSPQRSSIECDLPEL